MPDHTSSAFDEDLRELSSRLAEMGGLAERLLAAMISSDSRQTRSIISAFMNTMAQVLLSII